MFTILDYSSALEYSIIRRYTNIVYYYYYIISGMHGDLWRVADGFWCRRCDGTIQEADLAEDLMVD